ncbi:hypothetical protein ACQCN2_12865 [Brevibacillus ginsengisoli]|uniref:hypothetical protein n=1 Tax=Brevibacillus ginsengisoli TaxID=363854 RepID=UPI003CE9E237
MAKKQSVPVKSRVEYQGELTGTLAETADLDDLGMSYSPIQAMWQVNPEEEESPRDKHELPIE